MTREALESASWWLLVALAGLGLVVGLLSGCVTGGQVCLETAHSYGPGGGLSRDSVGASACVTIERRGDR